MKRLLMIAILAVGCSATAEARRAQIESSEDKFCALIAKERQLEKTYALEPDAGEAGSK